MKKVYKIIISIISLLIIIAVCYMIKNDIYFINLYKEHLLEYTDLDVQRQIKTYVFQYAIYLVANILTLLLIPLFNFLLWFKQLFCYIPLTAEQKAEKAKIIQENKKKKLQEKLNKLN